MCTLDSIEAQRLDTALLMSAHISRCYRVALVPCFANVLVDVVWNALRYTFPSIVLPKAIILSIISPAAACALITTSTFVPSTRRGQELLSPQTLTVLLEVVLFIEVYSTHSCTNNPIELLHIL